MRFVGDESCAGAVIRALRLAGHDVLAIAESNSGIADDLVIPYALKESRILITEDRDFGELVFAHGHRSPGVILLRFAATVRSLKPAAAVMAVAKLSREA